MTVPSRDGGGKPCPYCKGEGWRTEYVGSRFLGTEMQAHPVTVKCWSCKGSGKAVTVDA